MDRKTRVSYAAVHDAIHTRIVKGRYRPSRRIGIAELAQQLGVSTTPVREALRQLAGREIVVERPREGFYLAPLSASAISSLYRAHASVIGTVLTGVGAVVSASRGAPTVWRLFDDCASLSGDEATIAIRRYLQDRLAALRRAEAIVCHDLAIRAKALASALVEEDRQAACKISEAFHGDCAGQAARIALLFDPVT